MGGHTPVYLLVAAAKLFSTQLAHVQAEAEMLTNKVP